MVPLHVQLRKSNAKRQSKSVKRYIPVYTHTFQQSRVLIFPSTRHFRQGRLDHHTIGPWVFGSFPDMSAPVLPVPTPWAWTRTHHACNNIYLNLCSRPSSASRSSTVSSSVIADSFRLMLSRELDPSKRSKREREREMDS